MINAADSTSNFAAEVMSGTNPDVEAAVSTPEMVTEVESSGASFESTAASSSDHNPVVPEPVSSAPVLSAPVLSAPVSSVSPTTESATKEFGRFSRAELQAMAGKRGRKPPEFYVLFPRSDEVAAKAIASTGKSGGKKAPRAKALPSVSSAIIGEHSIDELLAMIGTTGRKPVAYDILQQAAQIFVQAGEVELPIAPVEPLVADFAKAPKGVREAIVALLAATRKR